MPDIPGLLRGNAAYLFIAVGVVWIAVAIVTGSSLLAWPVVACLVSGALLKLYPSKRITWAWAISTAGLGLLLSAYQVYAWSPFIGGAFSTLAGSALAVFVVLAAAHVVLLYAGTGPRLAK
jgi:hypothetical protein